MSLALAHQFTHASVTDWLSARPSFQACDYGALKDYLPAGTPQGAVLAPLFEGPQLVYQTGMAVISSPYHRNISGIEAGYELLWRNPDSLSMRALAQQRQLTKVVICRTYYERGRERIAMRPDSLISRLGQSAPPDWLEKLPLPDELAEKMVVYQLRPVH